MKQKKLLLLGGLRYLIPVIEKAQAMGIYVITCDYLPDNIAHKYSDEYHNISITDKEAVLKLAQELEIDGIMSFAVDPGVVTAGYVCEKMGLPSPGPYKSIEILQNKSKFRTFLTENGFNVPTAKSFKTEQEALNNLNLFNWPIIVKPIDSAGSKGVNKVTCKEDLKDAIIDALKNSPSKEFIIEDFIEQKGYATGSDCFSINGKMFYTAFSNQLFDKSSPNPYTPSAHSWPSSINEGKLNEIKSELQRLISLLNMKSSIYNIEARIGVDNKAYIMEVSPRGGGNRLAEIIEQITNIDLISNSIRASIGLSLPEKLEATHNNYFWLEHIVYSNENGIFKDLVIDKNIINNIVKSELWVKKGDVVEPFTGANQSLGIIILKFESKEQMEEVAKYHDKYITVEVE